MAVVFSEVANAFVRIEQHIFVPAVSDSVDLRAAPLEPDDFVVGTAELAARAKRDEGPDITGFAFELLEDIQVGVFGVADTMTVRAHEGFIRAERTQNNRFAALRTIQRLRCRLWR